MGSALAARDLRRRRHERERMNDSLLARLVGAAKRDEPFEARQRRFLRKLDDAGDGFEARIVDQPPEGIKTDLADADLVVAIDALAERFLRIVEVERRDPTNADLFVELGEKSIVPAGGAKVVTGREAVLGVEAYGEAIAERSRMLDDRRDLVE